MTCVQHQEQCCKHLIENDAYYEVGWVGMAFEESSQKVTTKASAVGSTLRIWSQVRVEKMVLVESQAMVGWLEDVLELLVGLDLLPPKEEQIG